MKRPGLVATAAAAVAAMTIAACAPKDARALWRQGIRDCARTDLLGPTITFLGPSNDLGPGSVFQEFQTGGIQVSHLFSEYSGSNIPALLRESPTAFTCSSDSVRTMALETGVSLESALNVSGDVGAQLKRASKVSLTADSMRWDELITSPYRDHVIKGLPDTHSVKVDLLKNKHMVLARALKVTGMVATLEFSSNTGVDVKAKLPDGAIPTASTAVKFGGAWDGTSKLTLTAPAAFYIVGELRHFSATGLSGGPASEIGNIVANQEALTLFRK